MPGFLIPFDVCNENGSTASSLSQTGPPNTVETARAYRFELEVLSSLGTPSRFGTFDLRGMLFFLKSATRPSVEIDQMVIHNGQDEIYRPGKQRWSPVELTFYEVINAKGDDDNIENWAPGRMFAWWARNVLVLEESRRAENFSINAQLSLLDGNGKSVWTYYLYQAWPIKVTPSDLNYTSTDLSDISVSLRFNKAWEKVPE